VGADHPAVGQQLARVVEDDHSVAEQAPPLFGMGCHRLSGFAVGSVGRRALWPVWAHHVTSRRIRHPPAPGLPFRGFGDEPHTADLKISTIMD
jgi:hypothetical protein